MTAIAVRQFQKYVPTGDIGYAKQIVPSSFYTDFQKKREFFKISN
jgi:hypothetical protein